MSELSVQRTGEQRSGEGVGVEQIAKDRYLVTLVETPWEVNLSALTCKCPDYKKHIKRGPYACKHIVTADAVARIPAGPGAEVAVERVIELCRAIYVKKTSLTDSYATLSAALHSPHSTLAMRRAAIQKHGARLARQAA